MGVRGVESIDHSGNQRLYFQAMSARNIKEEAKRLLEKLPEDLTWDQLMHEIYVRQSIDAGLADSKAGESVEVEKVRERFGLPS